MPKPLTTAKKIYKIPKLLAREGSGHSDLTTARW